MYNSRPFKMQLLVCQKSPLISRQLWINRKLFGVLFSWIQWSKSHYSQSQLPPEVEALVDQFEELFSEAIGSLTHSIPLVPGAQSFRLKPYRYKLFQKDEIERQVVELLKKNLIQESTSPFASPVLLVKNKIGDWRLYVDYRRLNAYTIKNKFPLPIIDELFEELYDTHWFITLDLRSGFH